MGTLDTHETEARILDAALRLWREGGIGAVTTRGVAHRAGVNEVTLFRHFVSKEGLLQAMVQQAVSHGPPPCAVDPTRATATGFDLAVDLRGWARAYLERTLPVGDVILLGLVEAHGRPELAGLCLEVPARLRTDLVAHLRALHDAGLVAEGPYDAVAEMLYARLFVHVLTHGLRPEGSEDREAAVVDAAVSVCVRALAPGVQTQADASTASATQPLGGAQRAHGSQRS